jgi:hypothetical protein
MVLESPAQCWLVVSVSTVGAAGSLRVQVWRKLRSLGALSSRSACYGAARGGPGGAPAGRPGPLSWRNRAAITHGVHRPDRGVRGDRRDEAARDDEYAEVLERLSELRPELAAERARGNATYAEVEESEADLDRFRTGRTSAVRRQIRTSPISSSQVSELRVLGNREIL